MTQDEWNASEDPEEMLRYAEYDDAATYAVNRVIEILTVPIQGTNSLDALKPHQLADAFEFGSEELRKLLWPRLDSHVRQICRHRIDVSLRYSDGTLVRDISHQPFVHSQEKNRRFRLFGYWCCHTVEHLITDEYCKKAFLLSGRLADNTADERERQKVMHEVQIGYPYTADVWHGANLCSPANRAAYYSIAENAVLAANVCFVQSVSAASCKMPDRWLNEAWKKTGRAYANLLREALGDSIKTTT